MSRRSQEREDRHKSRKNRSRSRSKSRSRSRDRNPVDQQKKHTKEFGEDYLNNSFSRPFEEQTARDDYNSYSSNNKFGDSGYRNGKPGRGGRGRFNFDDSSRGRGRGRGRFYSNNNTNNTDASFPPNSFSNFPGFPNFPNNPHMMMMNHNGFPPMMVPPPPPPNFSNHPSFSSGMINVPSIHNGTIQNNFDNKSFPSPFGGMPMLPSFPNIPAQMPIVAPDLGSESMSSDIAACDMEKQKYDEENQAFLRQLRLEASEEETIKIRESISNSMDIWLSKQEELVQQYAKQTNPMRFVLQCHPSAISRRLAGNELYLNAVTLAQDRCVLPTQLYQQAIEKLSKECDMRISDGSIADTASALPSQTNGVPSSIVDSRDNQIQSHHDNNDARNGEKNEYPDNDDDLYGDLGDMGDVTDTKSPSNTNAVGSNGSNSVDIASINDQDEEDLYDSFESSTSTDAPILSDKRLSQTESIDGSREDHSKSSSAKKDTFMEHFRHEYTICPPLVPLLHQVGRVIMPFPIVFFFFILFHSFSFYC